MFGESGTGTSATTNGAGCDASQRSMAGSCGDCAVIGSGIAANSAIIAVATTAPAASRAAPRSRRVNASKPNPASTASASTPRIVNRDGARMKLNPGSQ